MLDEIKVILRITSDAFDDEVKDLIDAAKADLALTGLDKSVIDVEDALIKRAITTYCKAYFGYENDDFERLVKAYDLLKAHLTLSVDYIPEDES